MQTHNRLQEQQKWRYPLRYNLLVSMETNHVLRWMTQGNWKAVPNYEYELKLVTERKAYVVYFTKGKMTSVIVNGGRDYDFENIRLSTEKFFGDSGHGLDVIAHLMQTRFIVNNCYECKDSTVDHLAKMFEHRRQTRRYARARK